MLMLDNRTLSFICFNCVSVNGITISLKRRRPSFYVCRCCQPPNKTLRKKFCRLRPYRRRESFYQQFVEVGCL